LEETDRKKRIDQHWEEVLRKQKLAKELRVHLVGSQADLRKANQELSMEQTKYSARCNALIRISTQLRAYTCRQKVINTNYQIQFKKNEMF